MDEQIYQPPTLVELGEFSEDTLGSGPPFDYDSEGYYYY
jgi:hypothetical protein